MKKKLIVLVGVVFVAVFFGRMLLAGADKDQTVSMDWEIKENNNQVIELLNSSQNIDIDIQQTESEYTKVLIEGTVSQKTYDKIQEVKVEGNSLNIQLGSDSMVGLTMVSDDDDEALKLTILLGKEATVKKYYIDGTSKIKVKVPGNYNGKFKLNTNNEGEILNVPKTTKEENTVIQIDTAGDIDITE
ncbi:conserved exported hypothetical protein [Carnobacterium maltaromaticum]|uniref:hypothetical protein n=1 Tax=Carnobacterium maltaromaticum TaxID=2751 RepID=UPI000704AF06|nr:hypothetical protein [Carnobacterium maltaromaticum]KRN71175.1 hypothetical protein IV76_GL000981 [Carnobacterium maltaromaticum]CRH19530.1 conserved exported hypothetical protein [Carnobacterium maltaromaticum]